MVIHGYTGTSTKDVQMGTIKWKLMDEIGMEHYFHINNSIFDTMGHSLFNSQHWAQNMKPSDNAVCTTGGKEVQLLLGDGTHTHTMPIEKGSNVAGLQLPPTTTYTKLSKQK